MCTRRKYYRIRRAIGERGRWKECLATGSFSLRAPAGNKLILSSDLARCRPSFLSVWYLSDINFFSFMKNDARRAISFQFDSIRGSASMTQGRSSIRSLRASRPRCCFALHFHFNSFRSLIQKFLDGLCPTVIDSTRSCSAIAARAVDVPLRYKYRLPMTVKRLYEVNFVSPLSSLRDKSMICDDAQETSRFPGF